MTPVERTRATRSSHPYPSDRFDRVSSQQRVGAHRIAARSRRLSLYVWCGLIAVVIFTTLGVIWVNTVGGAASNGSQSSDQTAAAPAVEAGVVDPTAQVVILNGTPIDGLQANVEAAIANGQWGQVLFSDVAAERDVQISAIFYLDPADEIAARGLGAQLGGIESYQTENYADFAELGARLVVLLGQDYAGPGLQEAQLEAQNSDAAAAADAGTGQEDFSAEETAQ